MIKRLLILSLISVVLIVAAYAPLAPGATLAWYDDDSSLIPNGQIFTPTVTLEFTLTPEPTVTETATRTLTPLPTDTRTATVTRTRTATATSTATRTPTLTPTLAATSSMTPTATIPSTGTATVTRTASPTSTATATYTATSTPSPSGTAPPTTTATATHTSTSTPSPSGTAPPAATPTETATAPPGPTSTATATPTWTATPTGSATSSETATPTATPTVTQTATPTATPTTEYLIFAPLLAKIAPDAPGPFSVSSELLARDQVRLTWTVSASATSYNIWRSRSANLSGAEAFALGVPGPSYQLGFAHLPIGVYYVYVDAVNAWGRTRSNVVSIEILPPPTPTPVPGIFGRVTHGGSPAAGVLLRVRFYNGSAYSTAAETTTDVNGDYRFTNVGSLGSGQHYYVLYPNVEQTSSRLFIWASFRINAYTTGTSAAGGDFDIKNVELAAPPNNTRVSLPATFRWNRRGIAGDGFAFQFFELDPGTRAWASANLGDVDGFTVTGLPSDARTGRDYGWSVIVYNNQRDASNYGLAYYYRVVRFESGLLTDEEPSLQPLTLDDALSVVERTPQ